MPSETTAAEAFNGASVSCPRCPREGWTDAILNRCAGCNGWFAVDPETGETRPLEDPSEVFEDD